MSTCSPERLCVGPQRTRSVLRAVLRVAASERCWSTADSHSEHPWTKQMQTYIRKGEKKGQNCTGDTEEKLTVCYTGSTCPCLSHSCLFRSLRCWAFRSRICPLPLPLRETQATFKESNTRSCSKFSCFRCPFVAMHLREYTYSLPKCTCTVCLWFCTFHWSSDPAEKHAESLHRWNVLEHLNAKSHTTVQRLTCSFSHV